MERKQYAVLMRVNAKTEIEGWEIEDADDVRSFIQDQYFWPDGWEGGYENLDMQPESLIVLPLPNDSTDKN